MSPLAAKPFSILTLAGCVATAIALSACSRAPSAPTAVTFRQLGVCKGFETASGKVTAPADQAFAVFKVETIDNSKPAKAFLFDPANLYVDQSNATQKAGKVGDYNRRFVAVDSRLSQSAGTAKLEQQTIAAGDKRSPNGVTYAAIETTNPTGGPDAKKFDLDLQYDDWTSEKAAHAEGWTSLVVFSKANAGETFSLVEDCKSLPLK